MGIFNIFGKRDVATELTKSSPYKLTTEWVPYRLYANKNSSALLIIKIKNLTPEVLMTSVAAELPKNLAFEQMGLSKEREARLGDLGPNEEKEIRMEVFSGLTSDAGEYTIGLTAMAHYRDYGHILNAVKKRVLIEVV